ncbi:MAG: AAA family ATPase [Geminicoccaceae bacterium]
MKIKVRDFRCIEEADTNEARLIMITGSNQTGKTGLLEGCAAVLLGQESVFGSTKSNLSDVIREGAEQASVQIDFESGGQAAMDWPGKCFQRPPVPAADEVTVGRVDPAGQFDKRAWADFIRSIAGGDAKITGKVIRTELETYPGYTQERGKAELAGIAKSWDGQQNMAKQKALMYRREWIAITGQSFGETKAEDWYAPHTVPGDNRDDLMQGIEDLADKIVKKTATENFVSADKVDLQKAVTKHTGDVQKIEHDRAMTNKLIKIAEEKFEKYPSSDPVPCPHCGKQVVVQGNTVMMLGDYRRDSIEYRELVKELGQLANRQAEHLAALAEAKDGLTAAKASLRTLEAPPTADTDPRAMETLRQEKNALELRLGGLVATSKAAEAFQSYLFFNKTAEYLGPTGIRLKALQKAMPLIQEKIDHIAKYLFKGHQVSLVTTEDGIELLFDGQSYKSLTWNGDPNSYRLRIKYMFQFIRAAILGPDTVVILDRVDTLVDKGHLNRLLGYIVTENIQALMARSMPRKPDTDLLKQGGAGLTYWINDGKLEEV